MKLSDVAMPAQTSINTGVSPCPTRALVRRYGLPANPHLLSDKRCVPVALLRQPWRSWMVTRDIGPFKITGHRAFVEHVRQFHLWLSDNARPLSALLGTAGCLCVRWVRGAPGVLSNHALGLAIDYTVAGVLDTRGDRRTQEPLLELYSAMKRFSSYVDAPPLYWGAGFGIEDSMHFEASAELIQFWERTGAWR